jgi:hypothetical protein
MNLYGINFNLALQEKSLWWEMPVFTGKDQHPGANDPILTHRIMNYSGNAQG